MRYRVEIVTRTYVPVNGEVPGKLGAEKIIRLDGLYTYAEASRLIVLIDLFEADSEIRFVPTMKG